MKVEENNIQTFCGKDLFKWESWDELDAGTLQFYGVEFCIDYLKKYNGMCVVLSIEGQLDIFSADESGNDVHEWSGFVTKIPGFLAGEKVYRVVHEYDDEFRFNVTETIAICTTEQKADEIVEENKKDGLDENESYWSLVEELEGQRMYLITFLPCGTKFLVNQSSEEEALKSAVKANETVGEIEDVDLTLKSLYIIEPADFSTLIQLFQKEPYWGNTDDTIIFDD